MPEEQVSATPDAENAPRSGVGALFIREFLDRELSDFDQCSKHYQKMTPDELCAEMAFLLRPDIRAIPFGFSGYRHYALADVMIWCAADWRDMTNIYRGKMINLCIDLLDYNYRRTTPTSRDALFTAVLATLEHVRMYGLFPGVADVIVASERDHYAPFEEGVGGQVLERKR